MTARFKLSAPIVRDNIINAEVIFFNDSYMTIRITSDYPITSPISLSYAARGEYIVTIVSSDGSERDETYNFESRPTSTTIAIGLSKWEIRYSFGLPSDARAVTSLNWYIDFSEFSDSNFNYQEGNTTGVEFN